MFEIFGYEFMRNAFYVAILASIACGIIGTLVVIKRIVFISGGIAHTAFGGIGLGYFLGINPVWVVTPFSLISALILGIVSKRTKMSEDSAIGMLWALGMALGILFIGLSPGYAPDLFSYLFGNILTVPISDIYLMIFLDFLIVGMVIIFYKAFLVVCYDEEYARSRGVNVMGYYLLLLALIALTIVVLIRVVGIILVISLLTTPASISKLLTQNLKLMMVLSMIIGAFLTTFGLIISYLFDLPSGASIILISVLVYFLVYFFKK